MAFARIAFTIPQYEDFPNYWLKAFEQGTTTPKIMATDPSGTPIVAKLQLNAQGFPITAGNAMVIPLIDGAYDLWIFPTEAEADANNTSNALQFADNVTGISTDGAGSSGVTIIKENQTLSTGQTTVTTSAVDFNNAEIHVNHDSIDSRKLDTPEDYTITSATEIELTKSYPNGTIFSASGGLLSTVTNSLTGNFPSDAAKPLHAMTFDFTFSDEPNQGMQGVDIDLDNDLVYISQNVKAGGVSSYDPAEMVQLAVYDLKTDGSTVLVNSATPQLDLGHGQDLSLEKVGLNIFLWTSAKTATSAGGTVVDYEGNNLVLTNVDAGRSIARVEYKGASTANSDITEFQLFPAFSAGDDSTWFYRFTPKISTCGRYIVAKASNMRGRYLPKIFVWLKSDIEAGTFTNTLAEFFIPAILTNNPDLSTVQAVHIHDDIIYIQLGFTEAESFKKIVRFSLNGSLIDHYDFYADTSYIASPPETKVEPEGITFIVNDGALRMACAFNINTASENTKSLHIFGPGEALEHRSEKASPATMAFDDNLFDISYQSGEALRIWNYDYVNELATPVFRLDSNFNMDLITGTDISMQSDKVLRKNDAGVGRETLFIRAKDILSNGAGINLYGSADANFPDQISMFAVQGVFYGNVTGPPPTPTVGGTLYVESGALKFIGSGGTITTLGLA